MPVTFDVPSSETSGASSEDIHHEDIPDIFRCSMQGFFERFPNNSPQLCFLGPGREDDARIIMSKSAQTKDLWQTVDNEHEGRRVFIKHTVNSRKNNQDIIRELYVCSKMVQHREHIRFTAGDNATARSSAYNHLSLPLAACVHDDGGFLIASPLLVDTEGNQAEDLMAALMSERELPGITAARTDERALRDLVKPLFTAVHQMHILNVAHRDMKPDNVLMLKSERKLVLIDFGHSKHVPLPGVRAASCPRGTLGWVPWNVCDAYHESAVHDALKIDVFSLAQLLIAILFLKPPVVTKTCHATDTAAAIEKVMKQDERDSGGVPLDNNRPGFPALSRNLRDLLTGMLVQGNDKQRFSMRGALQHDWFTNEDPTLWNPPPAEPEEQPREHSRRASESSPIRRAHTKDYETLLIEEWHVMTAHSPVELIQEYPCKDKFFQDTFQASEPWPLDHPLMDTLVASNSIRRETFERALEYDMKYYTVKAAKPYVEVDGDVLNALQSKFPDAVPLSDQSAPGVASQAEMTAFVRSSIKDPKHKMKPVMYKKPGAFARKTQGGTVQQTVEPPQDDNPYCFSFHAPWMNNLTELPATSDVALGDFLGVLIDDKDPSRDHVWKLPRCWFVGPAASFTHDPKALQTTASNSTKAEAMQTTASNSTKAEAMQTTASNSTKPSRPSESLKAKASPREKEESCSKCVLS